MFAGVGGWSGVECAVCALREECAHGSLARCDPGTLCPYTKVPHLNDLESNTVLCDIAFGVPDAVISDRVAWSNAYWGGSAPQVWARAAGGAAR